MIDRRSWALVSLLVALPAAAEELPRWELGVGVGVVNGPDYRGSDQERTYVLPIPYVIYRGDRLRADRRGVRGELFESETVSFNISGTLGFPTRSNRNEARAGLPNLDPTLEIGPSFNVRLYENAARDRLLSLRLPVRGAIATDLSHADFVGWVFLPHLAFDFLNLGGKEGWRFGVSAGPIYATNRYHDYFYAVPPAFATATRPAYDAPGGYSGASVGITLSRRVADYWVGAFLRYDDLHNAAFEDSPLVRTNRALVLGFAVSKVIARSDERVSTKRIETEP